MKAMDDSDLIDISDDEEEADDTHPLMRRAGRRISDEEFDWTMELKEAMARSESEGMPELEEEDIEWSLATSDFEVAKTAIVHQGDTQAALWSIRRVQLFRHHYGVDHSVDQGVSCLEAFVKAYPGHLLHLDVNNNHEAITVMDAACLNADISLRSDKDWKAFILGVYYIRLAIQPTIQTIRQGEYNLTDFGGLTRASMNMELHTRASSEVMKWYPHACRTFLAFNTGVRANIFITLLKPFMPKAVRESVELGCQIDEEKSSARSNRLKHFYLQPNRQEAERKLLARAKALLQYRAHNERVFRLW